MSNRILVVDDDPELRDLLKAYLGAQGFEVSVLDDGRSLTRHIEHQRPDLVVLDVTMPEVDGLTALRTLRDSGDDIHVVMLTGRVEESDRIVGFELGADDYLGKPFNPRELVARIRAILRRQVFPQANAAPHQRAPYRFGRFTLDFQSRTLSLGNQPLVLSDSEFALLTVFVNSPMCTLTRERLLKSLRGPDYDATDRAIDVQVWRLRRVLEDNPSMPRLIQTVRGLGYVFVPEVAPQEYLVPTSHSTL